LWKGDAMNISDDLRLSIITEYKRNANDNGGIGSVDDNDSGDDNDNNKNSAQNKYQLPLIRLRVDYTGFAKLRASRFAQQFFNMVANPDEILLFHQKKRR